LLNVLNTTLALRRAISTNCEIVLQRRFKLNWRKQCDVMDAPFMGLIPLLNIFMTFGIVAQKGLDRQSQRP